MLRALQISQTRNRYLRKSRSDNPLRMCCCSISLAVISLLTAVSLTFTLTNRESKHSQANLAASSKEGLLLQLEQNSHARGIVMSCPIGQPQNHLGNWKPRRMVRGVEAVIQQLYRFNSSLPLFFGYYDAEAFSAEPWCRNMTKTYANMVTIFCYRIPEKFPYGLYGYAKIFAIRHAPVGEVLWLDCDVYPVRSLDPLFEDRNFQSTGAMFWPDSRDFFDERKLRTLSRSSSSKKHFPLNAWWVKQGFDSGLVLIHRKRCAKQIQALCFLTRFPNAKLQTFSLGDKDLFHVIWILHSQPFTLIPYIGESGNIQTTWNAQLGQSKNRRRRFSPGSVGWKMSSQLKYGCDGNIYALHQLHRQASYAFIATLSSGEMFHRPNPHLYNSYVKPFVLARKDLRMQTNASTIHGGDGNEDFIGDIERALVSQGKGEKKVPLTMKGAKKRRRKGLIIRRSPRWLNEAAADMNRHWYPNLERILNPRKKNPLHGEDITGQGMTIQTGKLSKPIYNRLRHSFRGKNRRVGKTLRL